MEHLTIRIEGEMKQRIENTLEILRGTSQGKLYAATGKQLTQSDIVRMILHIGLNTLEKGGELLAEKDKEKRD